MQSKEDAHVSVLKLLNEFRCEIEQAGFNKKCKSCDYFYTDAYHCPNCLKENVKNWAVYHAEQGQ